MTDEEDSDFEGLTNGDSMSIERGRSKYSFKNNSSNVSLVNMSTMSGSSTRNQAITQKYSGRLSDRKDSKVRYFERRDQEIN